MWSDLYAPVSGTLDITEIQEGLSQWAPSGDYWLTGADIADYIGNLTTYGEADVQSIFRNRVFRVENALADNQLPIILDGTIKTPSVSLSSAHAVFQADLTVYDATSGVGYALIYVQSPDGQFTNLGGSWAPSPIRGQPGKLTVAYNFTHQSYLPTGAWKVTEVALHNYAGTVLDIKDASQIKSIFGTTTFQVAP